jgi:hypothetical protein
MKMGINRSRIFGYSVLAALLASGCSTLPSGTADYVDAWEEVVESSRWQASLEEPPGTPSGTPSYFALPEFSPQEATQASPEFIQRYPVLVSRAYFRLISEAMEVDQEVARSYSELYREARSPENQDSERLQEEFRTAERRFIAHREMLEGLRSWNAFSRYGSDDLDFFLQEEFDPTYQKYERGVKEDDLVDYLMRRLADLYHKQYGGLAPEEFFQRET